MNLDVSRVPLTSAKGSGWIFPTTRLAVWMGREWVESAMMGGLNRLVRDAILLQVLLHKTAGLEPDKTLRWNSDLLKSLGILSHPGGPRPGLENTKVAKLQTVALAQLISDLIQKGLDNLLSQHPLVTS